MDLLEAYRIMCLSRLFEEGVERISGLVHGTYHLSIGQEAAHTGLAMALRGEQISDFPLCNKSFNLSYCGHDL